MSIEALEEGGNPDNEGFNQIRVAESIIPSRSNPILSGPAKRTSLVIVEELDRKVENYVKNEGMLKSRFVNEAILLRLAQLNQI